MTRDSKKPAARQITPVNNRRSSVSRIVKRTTLRDESKDPTDSTVDEQVAALKKIPADRIAKNELEIKAAETAARLRETLSENVRLSSAAESARKEMARYRQLYEKTTEDMKHAVDVRNESEQQRLKADSRIEELQDEILTLRRELSARTHPEKRTEYLRVQPDQMAEMIADFEQALSGSLTGLMLSNLELRLKVAVDTEDDGPVLVLPPLSKGKIRSDSINELVVRVLPSGVVGI
jgi:chromosome segregation ATPase